MRKILFSGSIGFVLFITSCALFSTGPMDVLTYESLDSEARGKHLFVFMRGMGGSHHSFEKEGLVTGVRARGLPFDMAAPNAHFGYYRNRSLIDRLRIDVIEPLRAKGYEHIWLVGFSLGGLGSLLYLMERPEDIAGVLLISPFLGEEGPILEEIESAGGIRSWKPGPYNAEKDWERMLYDWLKRDIADRPEKKVYLGYASDDPYAGGQRLLADILPLNRVYHIQGGHDYKTFKAIWSHFLDNEEADATFSKNTVTKR
jgi:pimeloyl-ACP methyl ester carboxylesterase